MKNQRFLNFEQGANKISADILFSCSAQARFTPLHPSHPGAPMDYFLKEVESVWIALRQLWSHPRQLAFQALNLAMIVFSALMIWKGLMFLTLSESPVVVVLSGSMEPAFQRGDILFLNNNYARVDVGDIVVFKIAGRDIPIVHRVLRVHAQPDGSGAGGALVSDFLTKGDNNPVDDRNLYAVDQLWLRRPEVLGTAVAALPYVGYVTIILQDYPVLKYVLVGLMGLFVLTGKESCWGEGGEGEKGVPIQIAHKVSLK